jgi:hypothetical protein
VELLVHPRSTLSAPGLGVVGPHEREDEERWWKTILTLMVRHRRIALRELYG